MEAYGELARYYLVTKKTEKAAAIAAYMKAHPSLIPCRLIGTKPWRTL